jgi:hypothetical protein
MIFFKKLCVFIKFYNKTKSLIFLLIKWFGCLLRLNKGLPAPTDYETSVKYILTDNDIFQT